MNTLRCERCGRTMSKSKGHECGIRSLWDRLWEKVDATGDCWEFTGSKSFGYGKIGVGGRGQGWRAVHRVAWELLVGPIPAGLELDHLCRNRACVNPDHLEPVTNTENNRRSHSRSAQNSRKTVCLNGHPLSGANLRMQQGARLCWTCALARGRKPIEQRLGHPAHDPMRRAAWLANMRAGIARRRAA